MKRALMMLVAATCCPALAQTDSQLRYACKQIIERQLHDPSAAQLDWTSGKVSKDKSGLHIVRFRGRAKNAYGALVLATFECTLRYVPPDDFRAVNIRTF